jgi:hypothetical protein
MNGVAFGLLVGDDDGESVQNTKLVVPSVYLYLIDFCDVFVRFCITGSQ